MKSSTLRLLLMLFGLLAGAFVVWVIYSADGPGLPRFIALLYDYPNGDKLGHFLLMGGLAFLLTLPLSRRYQLPGLGFLAVLIAIEEFSQRFFNNRHPSWSDLACSLAGVVVFGGLALWLSGSFRKIKPEGIETKEV